MKLILHAPAVHQGGGKTLLLASLQALDNDVDCALIADARLDLPPLPHNIKPHVFPPTLMGRIHAERRLTSLCCAEDVVLCMNSLPPLLPCAGRISVYLQNRYLCTEDTLAGFPWRTRMRISVERCWLRRRLRPGMRLYVQTLSMQRAAQKTLSVFPEVAPFCDVAQHPRIAATQSPLRFIYPATPDPHKNHLALFQAWRLLHQDGITAELHVTIANHSPLSLKIEDERAAGIPIINHGEVDAATMAALYQNSTALIFPSKMESFGLPLLEAQAACLPIVAAELDYVRDVSTPAETFDPDSPVSIARAVKRHLGAQETLVKILTPGEFIHSLMTDGADRDGHAV
ncbi:MAG: glycosyltransferase [Burkholderiales bacterium]